MNSIADRYAATKAQIEALETELKALRNEIIASGKETFEGNHVILTVGLSERESLDTKLAREFLTISQLAACTKKTTIETIRIKAKVGA